MCSFPPLGYAVPGHPKPPPDYPEPIPPIAAVLGSPPPAEPAGQISAATGLRGIWSGTVAGSLVTVVVAILEAVGLSPYVWLIFSVVTIITTCREVARLKRYDAPASGPGSRMRIKAIDPEKLYGKANVAYGPHGYPDRLGQ